jgi:hypothetical protein
LADQDGFVDCLRSNEVLSPRFEGVEVVGATRTGVYPGYRSKPGTIDPSGVIIYPCQVGLLTAINPQRQAAIVCTDPCRCPPVHLDKVRYITDREPIAVRQVRPSLISRHLTW